MQIAPPYCRVRTPETTYEGVSFNLPIEGGVATIRERTEILEQRGGVEDVTANAQGERVIVFDDGTRWVITDMKRPCNCGG